MSDHTDTTECPCCFGDGGYDERDCNALLREHLTEAQLALVPNLDKDWLDCDECEGTGVVTVERAAEIAAWAKASVDQFLAKMKESPTRPRRA